jgi:predicted MFS family arabinose efflux permease
VDAGIRTVGHFATLAGAVGGGLLATYFGARFALVLSAALFAAAALLTYVKLVAMNHRRISQGESHGDKT